MKVEVKGGGMSKEEREAYIKYAKEKYPDDKISALIIRIDGDYVNLEIHKAAVPFVRIRRVTGYLAGDLTRFNNAKKSEEKDRVKHGVPQTDDE